MTLGYSIVVYQEGGAGEFPGESLSLLGLASFASAKTELVQFDVLATLFTHNMHYVWLLQTDIMPLLTYREHKLYT